MQMAHAIQASPLHLHTELALILQGKYSGRFCQGDDGGGGTVGKTLFYTSSTTTSSSSSSSSSAPSREIASTEYENAHLTKSKIGAVKADDTQKNVATAGAGTGEKKRHRKWSLISTIYNFFQI